MYQVVIVDDEVPQQQTLSRILKEYFQDYRVVKICSSVEEQAGSRFFRCDDAAFQWL